MALPRPNVQHCVWTPMEGRSSWCWFLNLLDWAEMELRKLGGSPSAYQAAMSDTTAKSSRLSASSVRREEPQSCVSSEGDGTSGNPRVSPEKRAQSNTYPSGTPATSGKSFKLPALLLSQGDPWSMPVLHKWLGSQPPGVFHLVLVSSPTTHQNPM